MRRFIGTALALGLVAAISWQVSAAQTGGEQIVICTRAGTDVRSPDTQGRCPSGYTKRTIENGSEFDRNAGKSFIVSFHLLTSLEQGDELDLQITAAAPDGDTRSTIVQDVSAFGSFGSHTFADPVIGGYDFGIRVIGPLQRNGDTVPFRVIVQRSDESHATLLDDLSIDLATTCGDIVETTPYVYTAAPIVRPPT
jgi:hypothetical protein